MNEDPNTRGITRLVVSERNDQVLVHAWGSCTPQDCDWGEQPALVDGNSASITWDQGFVLRTMTLSMLGTSRMQTTTRSVYTDNRPPRTSSEVFVRR